MSDLTGLIHHPYRPPEGFEAPQMGVHKASTVYFPNVAALRARDWREKAGYTYGLHGTPTTYVLEERIAHLEGGGQCVLVPSGLSAISTTSLALLASGDEVLIPDNAYGPNKALALGELTRLGVTHQLYDPMDPADLARRFTERTRLVWLEAPGPVTMEFPDLIEQVRLCRRHGVRVALDNTWGAGLAFRPFDLMGDGQIGAKVIQVSLDHTVHNGWSMDHHVHPAVDLFIPAECEPVGAARRAPCAGRDPGGIERGDALCRAVRPNPTRPARAQAPPCSRPASIANRVSSARFARPSFAISRDR